MVSLWELRLASKEAQESLDLFIELGGESAELDKHILVLYYLDLNRGNKKFLNADDSTMNRVEEILYLDKSSQLSKGKDTKVRKCKRKRKRKSKDEHSSK